MPNQLTPLTLTGRLVTIELAAQLWRCNMPTTKAVRGKRAHATKSVVAVDITQTKASLSYEQWAAAAIKITMTAVGLCPEDLPGYTSLQWWNDQYHAGRTYTDATNEALTAYAASA